MMATANSPQPNQSNDNKTQLTNDILKQITDSINPINKQVTDITKQLKYLTTVVGTLCQVNNVQLNQQIEFDTEDMDFVPNFIPETDSEDSETINPTPQNKVLPLSQIELIRIAHKRAPRGNNNSEASFKRAKNRRNKNNKL